MPRPTFLTLASRLALLCAGAGLVACAPFSVRHKAAFDSAVPAADQAYMAGRNHHLARRYNEARLAYQSALLSAPQHVNARNGLATLHAERREFGAAIAQWRALTESLTLADGPANAYLYSNLGHAYFLSGEIDNALVALEKACLLDPLNPRAWELLGETLRKLGQEERAQQMLSQAQALRAHDFRADYAASGAKSTVTAIERAVKTPVREESGWSHVQLHVGLDGMLELRRSKGPEPAPAPLLAREQRVGAAPVLALVEIRNGNGVRGMARTLARQLGTGELKVTRLSNQPAYNVRRTRIEYDAAHRAAAERLASRFGDVALHEAKDCAPANLRVVLGHDVARRGVALRPAVPEPGAAAPVLAARDRD
jgi:tetratricopeptide (TPR) repeat protein